MSDINVKIVCPDTGVVQMQRMYDQSETLAQEIARQRNMEFAEKLRLAQRLLEKRERARVSRLTEEPK